jgi:hypothetical protein
MLGKTEFEVFNSLRSIFSSEYLHENVDVSQWRNDDKREEIVEFLYQGFCNTPDTGLYRSIYTQYEEDFLKAVLEKFIIYKDYTITTLRNGFTCFQCGSIDDLNFLIAIRTTEKYQKYIDDVAQFRRNNMDDTTESSKRIINFGNALSTEDPLFEDFETNTFKYCFIARETRNRAVQMNLEESLLTGNTHRITREPIVY